MVLFNVAVPMYTHVARMWDVDPKVVDSGPGILLHDDDCKAFACKNRCGM